MLTDNLLDPPTDEIEPPTVVLERLRAEPKYVGRHRKPTFLERLLIAVGLKDGGTR